MPSTTHEPPGGPDAGEPTMVASDEQLMMAFVGGSEYAFGELFARYNQPLSGFFGRRVGDQACAEELAQETFMAVIRGSTRYEARAPFRIGSRL